jgi:hypothetical protein
LILFVFYYLMSSIDNRIQNNTEYNEDDDHLEPNTDEIIEPAIQINNGDSFSSWEEAEIRLNQYAKASGFTLRRKRSEIDDDGIVHRRIFECSYSGERISNKVIDLNHQRQRPSRKIGCPWHINLSN